MTLLVLGSLLIIFGGLWWMFRIPGEAVIESASAPILAFVSVWLGVAAAGQGAWMWIRNHPELLISTAITYAAALSTAGWALWTYRHTPPDQMTEEIQLQRLQSRVGIALGLVAVFLWYTFIFTHVRPDFLR